MADRRHITGKPTCIDCIVKFEIPKTELSTIRKSPPIYCKRIIKSKESDSFCKKMSNFVAEKL